MYELIIKEFVDSKLLLSELIKIKKIDFFRSRFGSIDTSNDIYKLTEISHQIHPSIKTLIVKCIEEKKFNFKKITDIEINNKEIIVNFNTKIKIKDIISLSVQPLKEVKINPLFMEEKNLKKNLEKEFYFSFKILNADTIFWSEKGTRFYSNTSFFSVSKTFNENIIRLHFFIKLLNDRVLFSPLSKLYINHDNYIKYFVAENPDEKEFLWMKKIGVINI